MIAGLLMLGSFVGTVALTMLTPVCHLPFEVAKGEAAARAIAEAVIASAPDGPSDLAPYDLHLTWVDQRRSWLAVQSARPLGGVRFLGGGLGMEIAACDGAISYVDRQR